MDRIGERQKSVEIKVLTETDIKIFIQAVS